MGTPDGGQQAWRQHGQPRLSSDSASILRAYALAGLGVALLPDWLINADLRSGRLCRLLPDHGFPQQGIHALYPRTRHVPAKVRAFIDFCASARRRASRRPVIAPALGTAFMPARAERWAKWRP